jgi:hypothetical protein
MRNGSAWVIAMRGRLQNEGEVIHIVCDRITDQDEMLRSIGRVNFTVAPGCGNANRSQPKSQPRTVCGCDRQLPAFVRRLPEIFRRRDCRP